MLNVVMLSVIMQSVVVLNVVILSVIMLNVVMLNVVVPKQVSIVTKLTFFVTEGKAKISCGVCPCKILF